MRARGSRPALRSRARRRSARTGGTPAPRTSRATNRRGSPSHRRAPAPSGRAGGGSGVSASRLGSRRARSAAGEEVRSDRRSSPAPRVAPAAGAAGHPGVPGGRRRRGAGTRSRPGSSGRAWARRQPAVRREQHLDPAVELARRDVVHAGVRIALARGVADRHPRREPQRRGASRPWRSRTAGRTPLRGRQELEDRVGVVASSGRSCRR